MIDILSPEALASLDALNSWVRSDSHRGYGYNSPIYAIYEWKRVVIAEAIAADKAELKSIYLTLNCRDCGGSGRYVDSHGEKFPHCRKCSSTGKTKLTFLVSKIGDYTWHTPWEKSWSLRTPEGLYQRAELSTDWEPNQKGRNLTTPEVAAHLNVLEPLLLDRAGKRWVSWDYGENGDYSRNDRYRLYLGRSEAVCEFCGIAANADSNKGHWHGCSRDYVFWSAWACDTCRALYSQRSVWSDAEKRYVPFGGNGKSIFDDFKPPVVTDPHVREWLNRRILVAKGTV